MAAEEVQTDPTSGLEPDQPDSLEALVAELAPAIGPSRREHPLAAGIRMFTHMLDEAKSGYIVDRLAHIEERMNLELTDEERADAFEISLAYTDDDDIPGVEFAVAYLLDARKAVHSAELPGEAEENLDEEPPDPL